MHMGDLNDLICLLPIVRMLVETLRMKIVLRVRSTGRHTQTIFLNPTKSLILVLLVAHPVSQVLPLEDTIAIFRL